MEYTMNRESLTLYNLLFKAKPKQNLLFFMRAFYLNHPELIKETENVSEQDVSPEM